MFPASHGLQKDSFGGWSQLAGWTASTISQSLSLKNSISSASASRSPQCRTSPGRSGTQVASMCSGWVLVEVTACTRWSG